MVLSTFTNVTVRYYSDFSKCFWEIQIYTNMTPKLKLDSTLVYYRYIRVYIYEEILLQKMRKIGIELTLSLINLKVASTVVKKLSKHSIT